MAGHLKARGLWRSSGPLPSTPNRYIYPHWLNDDDDAVLFQLEEVNWRQNLTMAQSGRSKLKQPNALFEFVVKEGEVSCGRGVIAHAVTGALHVQDREKVQVDFTHAELYAFYNKVCYT